MINQDIAELIQGIIRQIANNFLTSYVDRLKII
jgi:hypothetical protein